MFRRGLPWISTLFPPFRRPSPSLATLSVDRSCSFAERVSSTKTTLAGTPRVDRVSLLVFSTSLENRCCLSDWNRRKVVYDRPYGFLRTPRCCSFRPPANLNTSQTPFDLLKRETGPRYNFTLGTPGKCSLGGTVLSKHIN